MIKKIMIVLIIPSLIIGFLTKNFYPSPSKTEVGCTLSFFQDEKGTSSCRLYSYNELINPKFVSSNVVNMNKRIVLNGSIDLDSIYLYGIYLAGMLSGTIIYSDEIKNNSCRDLINQNNLLNKNNLKEIYFPNILQAKEITLYPTKTKGLFCTPNVNSNGDVASELIKLSPQHLEDYSHMLFKAKAWNALRVFLQYLSKILPFTILYLIYFSVLFVRYYIKLNIKFLKK